MVMTVFMEAQSGSTVLYYIYIYLFCSHLIGSEVMAARRALQYCSQS